MEMIKKYYPELRPGQVEQLGRLGALYSHWNQQINLISRRDMDHFYERHVLHSLGIAQVVQFDAGEKILDVGTGGGFPGIPLAVLFPEAHFTLVDSIGKKIKVVREVSRELGLQNVEARQVRAEELRDGYHHIVSRAVTQMPRFLTWVRGLLLPALPEAGVPPSIWYLKGGYLQEELAGIHPVHIFPLADFFSEDFFATKYVVQVPRQAI